MTPRKRTDFLVVHCSATPPKMDIGAKEIRRWHIEQDWSDIGYHYVIRRNGVMEGGRAENLVGAHAVGVNANSIGICLVGGVDSSKLMKPENNFTPEQFETLKSLLKTLRRTYPATKIIGHRDVPKTRKACPSFEVADWLKEVGIPQNP